MESSTLVKQEDITGAEPHRQPGGRSSASWKLARISLLAVVTVACCSAIYALANGWSRAHFRQQLDYAEGDMLHAAVLIARGQTPYPKQSWPVITNVYGPLPYYLVAIPVALAGPGLLAPRILVLFFCVLCGLLTGLLTRHFARSSLAGILATSLFLSHSLVRYWNAVLRVDLFGLALTLAGLWVFVRFPRKWLPAVLLMTAAVFTKPTFVAAPLACVSWLLVARQYRRAVYVAGFGIAIGLVALVALVAISHGGFWFDIFQTHPDPWSFSHYILMFHYFVLGDPVLIGIGIVAFGWTLWRKDFSVLTIYSIWALGATIGAGKLGSNDNHLLELTAVLCMVSSTALLRWTDSGLGVRMSASIALLILAAWLGVQLRYAPSTSPQNGCNGAYDLIQQMPSDRILSEDVSALVLAHKTVWVSDPFVYGQLVRAGRVSDEPVSSRIRTGWFSLILLSEDLDHNTDRWSPDLAVAIREHYHLVDHFECEGAKAAYMPDR